MIIWTIYNFSLVSVALLCCIEKPSRRNSERFKLEYIVGISTHFDNLTYWGVTQDISESGISIAVTTESINLSRIASSPEVKINIIDQNLALSGRVVRITTEADCLPRFSIMFNELSEDQESRLLQILYNPANKFLQPRIVSAGRSIILFVISLLKSSSLLQSFKS
jgi:c-di-GMP-binding flagellar brake protein YcgR